MIVLRIIFRGVDCLPYFKGRYIALEFLDDLCFSESQVLCKLDEEGDTGLTRQGLGSMAIERSLVSSSVLRVV